MKIYGRKGGHGHVTCYNASIGSAEAREAGFLNEDGTSKELEKIVDPVNHTITIRIKQTEEE